MNKKEFIQFVAKETGEILEDRVETYEDPDNRCGKPHNNGDGEDQCVECMIIKMGL